MSTRHLQLQVLHGFTANVVIVIRKDNEIALAPGMVLEHAHRLNDARIEIR